MKVFFAAFLVAFLAVGFNASAQSSPSFNNVQLTAQSPNFTSSSDIGYGVSAEKTLGSALFVVGSVDHTILKTGQSTNLRAGVGYRYAFGTGLVGYGDAYALHVGDVGLKVRQSYGYGTEAGVRDVFGPLQLSVAVNPERAVYNVGWTTYGKVGVQYNVWRNFAIVADYKYHNATERAYNLGVAYNF